MSRIFHLCTFFFFFFSSRRRHTRSDRDWSSDVCSSDLSLPCRAADAFRHAPLETLSPRPVEAPLREGGDQARSEGTRLNSSHDQISYAVFCLKKKNVMGQNGLSGSSSLVATCASRSLSP